MEFRDIHAFNLAMLAKRAWRPIHNTHSLFYRVYKVRYFLDCSFLEADIGSNPSYVWQSLLAVCEIIRKGYLEIFLDSTLNSHFFPDRLLNFLNNILLK